MTNESISNLKLAISIETTQHLLYWCNKIKNGQENVSLAIQISIGKNSLWTTFIKKWIIGFLKVCDLLLHITYLTITGQT